MVYVASVWPPVCQHCTFFHVSALGMLNIGVKKMFALAMNVAGIFS